MQEYGTMPCKGALREDFPFAINTKDMLKGICWEDKGILNLVFMSAFIWSKGIWSKGGLTTVTKIKE